MRHEVNERGALRAEARRSHRSVESVVARDGVPGFVQKVFEVAEEWSEEPLESCDGRLDTGASDDE